MTRRLWLLAAFSMILAACNPADDAASTTTGATTGPTSTSTTSTPGSSSTTGTSSSTVSPTPVDYMPEFEQGRCPFVEPIGREVTCGFVAVPEDRSQPGGNQVRIAIAVVKAEVGPSVDDPIIYLDGGPGGESLEPLQFTFDSVFEPFARTRDLVFFDQRGVGLSEPSLECTEDEDLTYALLDRDLPNSEFLDLQLKAIQECHDRLVSEGIDLSQYNSATNAADVADIRIALGYEEVNLLGISYGTRLAQTVMRDHPEGVRSVILDSVYTPDVDLTSATPANLDRALDELFTGCAASPDCNERYPDLESRLFDLVDEFDITPVIVRATDFINGDEYDVIVDGSDLLGVVFQGLYSEQIIPVLPQLVDELEDGSMATLSQLTSITLSNIPFFSIGMHLSVQCSEEIPFSDEATVVAADDAFPEFGDFFEVAPNIGPPVFDLCEIWDVDPLGPIENEAVSSTIPTLVLAGEYDPITPPAWGELVTRTLPNSQYLLAPGLGHGASLGSDCTAQVSLAFIEDPTGSVDSTCFEELTAPAWAGTPAAIVTFELEPIEIGGFGAAVQTLRPDTWNELQPGIFTRGASGVDQTSLIIQPFPPTFADEEVADLFGVGLGATSGLVELAGFEGWRLWQTTVQGFTLDLAVRTFDNSQVLVAIITSESERDLLIETVLEPILLATVPA